MAKEKVSKENEGGTQTVTIERPKRTPEETTAYYERLRTQRIEKAGERNAIVVNPEGGEAQVFFSLGRSVDAIFRTSRKQEQKLSVFDLNEMSATLEYKKALVDLSDKLKVIAKKRGREYKEEAIIGEYRKDLPNEEAMLEKFKAGFGEEAIVEEPAEK